MQAITRRELGFKEDNLVIGMVANYNRPVKGVTNFLDAIPGHRLGGSLRQVSVRGGRG